MKQSSVIKLSFVIPVYNRPEEVRELLESMTAQTIKIHEIVIVEDGSTITCEDVIEEFRKELELKYFKKPNSGPGGSRNYGFDRASGDYVIFLDSDCVLPSTYYEVVLNKLKGSYSDAFGGPDASHESFTPFQKAINYSMTSFFTTGGIRGGNESMGKFHPRSFNMGFSREVFEETKGFSQMRFGEDIDMSLRILSGGFETQLIKEAFVYHKRRTSVKQFFKQIYNSGIARINLFKRYPDSLKIVHTAPLVFSFLFLLWIVLGSLISVVFLIPLILYVALVFIDSSIKNKNLEIGLLSIVTSHVQLISYGIGFFVAFWKRIVLRKDEFSAFKNTFYD